LGEVLLASRIVGLAKVPNLDVLVADEAQLMGGCKSTLFATPCGQPADALMHQIQAEKMGESPKVGTEGAEQPPNACLMSLPELGRCRT
jgi:hypothetical protein